MRLSIPVWLRWGAAAALACAIAAGLVSFAWPDRYVSTALLRFRARYVPRQALDGRRVELQLRLAALQQESLSRGSLAKIIQTPAIDLYGRERRTSPMEDVIEIMRKQVRVDFEGPSDAFRISFDYPDAGKAQRTVGALVGALIAHNDRINESPARRRELIAPPPATARAPRAGSETSSLADLAPRHVEPWEAAAANREPPPAEYFEILDTASLPEMPVGPNRYMIGGIGLVAGFLLGVALFRMPRISPRRVAGMAAAALAGLVAAGGATFLWPDSFADLTARLPVAGLGAAAGMLAWALARGGRGAWRRPHYGKWALAGGALGAIAAGFAGYAIPVRYESKATLRMYGTPRTPGPAEDGRERLAELTDLVLSRSSLSELVQRPRLDLYSGDRQRRPMEDVIEDMRAHDLHIEPAGDTLGSARPMLAVRIRFAYPDRLKAQAVVRELVTALTERNVSIERMRHPDDDRGAAVVMQVLDPASLPEDRWFPQTAETMAAAAGVGAGLACLLAFLRRRPPGQAAAMLKLSAAGAVAGALLAAAIAFAIPSRYVSRAALRTRPGAGRVFSAAHVADYLRQESPAVLSRSSLTDLVLRPSLDLYRGQRARRPIQDVVERMRGDIRIESPGPARPTAATTIEFAYSDPVRAQAVVRELVTKLVEPMGAYMRNEAAAWQREHKSPDLDPGREVARLEVLDPASLPEAPAWPPRRGIIAGGLLSGALLGPALARVRRWRR